ncbi:MAG: DUF6020 family protein [Clostridia bacterium]
MVHKSKTAGLRALLCLLSLCALSIQGGAGSDMPRTVLLTDTALWVLGLAGLWALYGAWLALPKPFVPIRLWVLSAFFAGVVLLGRSFAAMGTAEGVTAHLLRSMLFFMGRVPLYFALMRLCQNALAQPAKPVLPKLFDRRGATLLLAGGLLLCWLPYWILTFPGTVSNDSASQLDQILGLAPFTNANPVFQTWLIDAFRHVGMWFGGGQPLAAGNAAVALFCGTQALLMAWLLGFLLHTLRKNGAPAWLLAGSFLFYAFCPIFPTFAFCMGKDTNFAMAVLFLSLMAAQMVREPALQPKQRGAQTIGLCIASVLCTLLRNPGGYLALLTLALLLLWALKHPRAHPAHRLWRAPALAMTVTLCCYAALHLLVLPSMHIAPMPETENYSLPLQQAARVAAGGELSEAEAAAVNGVLKLDELPAAYNGELSDPVKALWREDATAEQKKAFWKAWPRLVAKHPATCLSATFHNTYGYLYPGYMSTIKPTLILGKQRSDADFGGQFAFEVNPHAQWLKAVTERLAQNPLYRLLVSPGLYGWLTLFVCACLFTRGKRRLLLAAVPALFGLAGCLLSAVNGYFRYAMPLYLCAPLLLGLAVHSTQKGEICK